MKGPLLCLLLLLPLLFSAYGQQAPERTSPQSEIDVISEKYGLDSPSPTPPSSYHGDWGSSVQYDAATIVPPAE